MRATDRSIANAMCNGPGRSRRVRNRRARSAVAADIAVAEVAVVVKAILVEMKQPMFSGTSAVCVRVAITKT